MRALFAFLFCGCAAVAPSVCRTSCGVTVDKLPGEGWTCASVQGQENAILTAFPSALDARFKNPCSEMRGWTVRFEQQPSFTDPSHGEDLLAGLTFCDRHESAVSNLPPWESAYAHEMAHAIQRCSPNSCAATRLDDSHYCWETNNIYGVIDQVEKDTTPEVKP